MVRARRRFLGTGAYDPIAAAVADVVVRRSPHVVLDIGCGDGYYTRRLHAEVTAGIDVAKPAISAAARAHSKGWYAVASAAAVPMAAGAVDLAVNVFGPILGDELARVVRPGGVVVAVHPGEGHLAALRALVYDEDRPHDVKDPLRESRAWFSPAGTARVTFPIVITQPATLIDLFTMTPYRWHGPPDLVDRLTHTARFEIDADVVVSTYTRTAAASP
jgi:23S rRNA (guanine745-N1)-methyltransferase